MKHKISLLLMLVVMGTHFMSAYDFMVDGLCYNYNEDGSSVTVTHKNNYYPSYPSLSGVLDIPSSVTYNGKTYSVTSIDNDAFTNCSGLTSVTIHNSVTSIGNNAFEYCNGLTSVTIGNSVTSIGNYAFLGCTGLTSVTIPNSVTSIGDYAFTGCTGLTSVTIPNSVTSIGDYAFSCCTGLTSIVVKSGNQKYDSRNNCNAIIETATNELIAGCMNTVIPNSVTTIGNSAFSCCTGLTSVTIPNSVTSIGEGAFSGCSGLTSITIPNSVTTISSSAFSSCTGLTSVTIPNSVTSIDYGTFAGCTGLTSVTIPKSVTSIEDYAFSNCTSLTSVTIPNSVTTIGSFTFSYCYGLTAVTIPSSVTTIRNYAFSARPLTTVICLIPEPLTIDENVFSNYNANLYVREESYSKYVNKDPWSRFNVVANALATSISLDQQSKTINIGQSFTLTPTVLPNNAINKSVIWSSSNPSVASVDLNGLVRGVGAGTARITTTIIEDSNLSASCIVQVLYPTEAAGVGDVNEDGRIDITDATLIVSYLQGNYPMAVLDEALMDVNGDGDINMSDVLKVISLIRNDN